MANIEDRVVSMSFENSKFESGARNTIATLNRLNEALKHAGSGNSLNNINSSAQKVNLSHIGAGVDSIRAKLGALNVAAVAIFTNIALKAASAAASMVKGFTVDPIIQGLHEYQTNLNAVQTILANTQASGAKLKDVNKALNELNRYSDKTIYNFSEMAKNIGTFTAAGVDLKTSTAAIKGIANLAALSGSNSQQASTAMYQLSQAIAAGRVSLQDWNSVVNAGMGGTVFQRALAQTAEKMGTLSDGAVKLTGKMKNVTIGGKSFRESIQAKPGEKSWLTSDVLTKTLSHFTGDLTDAQLAAEGFSKAEIMAIQKQAKTAQNAATQVKTLKQVIDVAKESAGSGWAQTWQIIFGNFGEAKKTFTALSNAVNGFINTHSKMRNKILKDWKELGGRTVLIAGLKDVFHALARIANIVSDAFRDIFPAKTGKDLYNLTVGFKHFAESLTPSAKTSVELTKIFRGFFAILDIGKQIIVGFGHLLGNLFGSIGKSSGGFLAFSGSVGDWLVHVDEALKKGGALNHFFDKMAAVIKAPFHVLGLLKDALVALFTGVNFSGAAKSLKSLNERLSPMQKLTDAARQAWQKFLDILGKVHDKVQPIIDSIKESVKNLGPELANAFSNINFDQAMKVLGVGLLASFVFTFKKFVSGGFDNVLAKGLLSNISKSFGGLAYAFGGLGKALHGLGGLLSGLTGNLEAMQQRTKAQALKEIAIALALLAVSAVALSFIPEKKLQSAMGGIAIGLGELVGAMALLNKVGTGLGFAKLPILAGGLILIAGAIDVLVLAVLALSRLNWDSLTKGLVGVGSLLAMLTLAAKPLAANSIGLIGAGAGLTAIAVAMNILSLAVNTFGNMDLAKLGKGIGAVGASLLIIGGAIRIFPPGSIAIGVALNAIAASLLLISISVGKFGSFNWGTIGKGLLGIGASLGIIGAAMRIMPKNMIQQSIALGILGLALQGIARAVGDFGGMSLGTLAKGLLALAGSLVILGIALDHMKGSVRGAAALTIAALGLRLLAPALATLGKMSWSEIGKGLIALAGAIALLGVAGLLLEPVAPALLAFGVALLAIGGALALAGIGIALIGTGLSAIAVSGPAAIKILVSAFVQLAAAIPKVAKDVVMGLLAIVQQIAKVAPQFVAAMIAIGKQIVQAIIKLSPEAAKAMTALLKALIEVIDKNAGPLVEAGFKLLKDILEGIKRNIGGVVRTVGDIIVKFLNALASKTPQIVTAGTNLLIKFLQGISNNLGRIVSAVGTMIAKFVGAIASNINKIITAGASFVISIVKGISNNLVRIVSAGADALLHFLTGVSNNIGKVVSKGTEMAAKFINAVVKAVLRLVNVGADAVIKFLNGLATALRTKGPEIIQAGANLAASLIEGIIKGLASLPGLLVGKIGDLIKDAVNSLLGDELPSAFKKFYKDHPNLVPKKTSFRAGKNMVDGLKEGAKSGIDNWGNEMYTQVTGTISRILSATPAPAPELLNVSRFLGQGFLDGINGVETATDRVTTTVQSMSQKLQDGIISVNSKIKTETDNIARLTKANEGYTKQISDQVTQRTKNKDALNKLQAEGDAGSKKEQKARDDKIKKLKDEIKGENDVIDKLKERRKENNLTIADENVKLTANQDLVQRLSDARVELNKNLKTEKNNLVLLSAAYDENKQKLEDANQALQDAIRLRDDFAKSTATDFEKLPALLDTKGVTGSQQLTDYQKKLDDQAKAVEAYKATLDKLKAAGLDDMTYRKLLEDGVVDQSFADAILAGGKDAIDNLNATDTKLAAAATDLGNSAAKNLYQAGVDAAQGIVDGLNSEHDQIVGAMNKIAADMVAALKKKLKIKSPSKEFAKLGRFSNQGLVVGLRASTSAVTDAATEVGDNALSAMQDTMSRISDVMSAEVDLDPTIRPVLDLTQFKREARKMGGLSDGIRFGTDQALAINASQIDLSTPETVPGTGGDKVIKFEQNNYSPTALSESEIYRQTNNQLSQAKKVLGLT